MPLQECNPSPRKEPQTTVSAPEQSRLQFLTSLRFTVRLLLRVLLYQSVNWGLYATTNLRVNPSEHDSGTSLGLSRALGFWDFGFHFLPFRLNRIALGFKLGFYPDAGKLGDTPLSLADITSAPDCHVHWIFFFFQHKPLLAK